MYHSVKRIKSFCIAEPMQKLRWAEPVLGSTVVCLYGFFDLEIGSGRTGRGQGRSSIIMLIEQMAAAKSKRLAGMASVIAAELWAPHA